ncbi:hypothetical protein ACOMHN_006280 [Nucella lapillus]
MTARRSTMLWTSKPSCLCVVLLFSAIDLPTVVVKRREETLEWGRVRRRTGEGGGGGGRGEGGWEEEGRMMSRGKTSQDMAYVLLDRPLVPRLDLSDCRPTELPVLSKTTPSSWGRVKGEGTGSGALEGLAGQKSGIIRPMSAGASTTSDHVPVLPPAPVSAPKAAGTHAHVPHGVKAARRSAKRVGGVLKGGGDYVSNGEHRPRPRVSFLLDAAPGQGSEGGRVTQIRVFAKQPQVRHPAKGRQHPRDGMLNLGH